MMIQAFRSFNWGDNLDVYYAIMTKELYCEIYGLDVNLKLEPVYLDRYTGLQTQLNLV